MNVWGRFRRLAEVFGWGSWRRSDPLTDWPRLRVATEDGSAFSYGGELLELRDLTVNPHPNRGDYTLPATLYSPSASSLHRLSLLPSLQRLEISETPTDSISVKTIEEPVVAVQRDEWANIYHSAADLYNAYLACRIMGWEPAQVKVLNLDPHPASPFALWWRSLFHSTLSLEELPPSVFRRIVICPTNHESRFDAKLGHTPPLVDQLGLALRKRLQLPPAQRVISVISRERCAQRNLSNLDELLEVLADRLPDWTVRKLILESIDFEEQLSLVGESRLLVGAHGAGLTHALYLPEGSGVMEIFPSLPNAARLHFYNICRWRGLDYGAWINWRQWREPTDGRSMCDAVAVAARIQRMLT